MHLMQWLDIDVLPIDDLATCIFFCMKEIVSIRIFREEWEICCTERRLYLASLFLFNHDMIVIGFSSLQEACF